MKAIVILFFGVLMLNNTQAQDTLAAPENVLETFTHMYPDADSLVTWNESNQQWTAEFKSVGEAMTASFTNKGKWLESTQKLEMREIPEEVIEGLENDHPSAEMESFHKIDSKSFMGIAIQVTEGSVKKRYLYKESGEEYVPGK